MPQHYEHLTKTEREYIAIRRVQGASLRLIGLELRRSGSTISREVRRNTDALGRYYGRHAHNVAQRRWHRARKPRKLANPRIRREVEKKLRTYWAPEQIDGRRSCEGSEPVSRMTIYRHIDENPAYRSYLRGPAKGRGKKRERIHNRVMIDERPKVVERRERVGDWESDTVQSTKGSKACVAGHVDRKSLYLVARLLGVRNAEAMNRATVEGMKGLPVHTLTVDNGMEFGSFKKLEEQLEAKVFFAHEKKPWQRGRVENTNGLLRQFFPKGTDFKDVSPAQLRRAVDLINNRPRKSLGYRTPKEVMLQAGVALAM